MMTKLPSLLLAAMQLCFGSGLAHATGPGGSRGTHGISNEAIHAIAGSSTSARDATRRALQGFRDHAQHLSVPEKIEVWQQLAAKIESRHSRWKSSGPFLLGSIERKNKHPELVDPIWLQGAYVFHGNTHQGLAIRAGDGKIFIGSLGPYLLDSDPIAKVDYTQLEELDAYLARTGSEPPLAIRSAAAWKPEVSAISTSATESLWQSTDKLQKEFKILLQPDSTLFRRERWGQAVAFQDGRRVGSLYFRFHSNGALIFTSSQVGQAQRGLGIELGLAQAVFKSTDLTRVRQVYLRDLYHEEDRTEFSEQMLRDLFTSATIH